MKNNPLIMVLLILVSQVMVSNDAVAGMRSIRRGGIVHIMTLKQDVLTRNFNPFSRKALYSTFGCIYEPLIFLNEYSGELKPWLSKSYVWSSDHKTLVFSLRKEIRWSDGRPFTAEDVLFTFQLMKRHSSLDQTGIWSRGLKDVTTSASHSVSFVLTHPDKMFLEDLSSVYIVPAHRWRKLDDAALLFPNDPPVGTGPFVFEDGSFTDHSYRLKKNEAYWQLGYDGKPLPYIDGVQFIASTGSTEDAKKVISGEVDWGATFIPDIDRSFIRRDIHHNHFWLCEGNLIFLNLNNGKTPFSNRNIRKAIAYAINPKMITLIMNTGALPAGQTGLKKGFLSWEDGISSESRIAFDPDRAVSLLKREGYEMNDTGVMKRGGVSFSLKLHVPEGWNEFMTAADAVSSQLQRVGIAVSVVPSAWPSPFLDDIRKGNFDMAIDHVNSGFSPYDQYRKILFSKYGTSIGKDGSPHSQVHYSNTLVDNALLEYSQTEDMTIRLRSMKTVISKVIEDTPFVPLFFTPFWFTYTTRRFTGWPDEEAPYTVPKIKNMSKIPILLKLHSVK